MPAHGRVLPTIASLHSCLHRLQRSAYGSFAAPVTADMQIADRKDQAVPPAVANPEPTVKGFRVGTRAAAVTGPSGSVGEGAVPTPLRTCMNALPSVCEFKTD
jgi:hypothetical protein